MPDTLPAGWKAAERTGGAPGQRGELARILFEAGHAAAAMNLDFAYDDTEAAEFLRADLALIRQSWTGRAEDLARVERYAGGY